MRGVRNQGRDISIAEEKIKGDLGYKSESGSEEKMQGDLGCKSEWLYI